MRACEKKSVNSVFYDYIFPCMSIAHYGKQLEVPHFFTTPYVTLTSGFCEASISRLDKEEIEMHSWTVFFIIVK